LIFLPGFSTKDTVTEISGRGVGMDVVKNNIDKLQGQIEMDSEEGKGSTFKLKLPLSLSIIQGLIVEEGKSIYCIPSISLREILRVKKEELNIVGKGSAIHYRSEVLPVVPLGKVLGTKNSSQESEIITIIVLANAQKKVGLIVDRVIAQEELVVKPLGSLLKVVENVSGVTLRGRGEVAIVLDGARLIENTKYMSEGFSLSAPQIDASKTDVKSISRKILFAEDSVTTREIISDILEANGFEVTGEINGATAWQKMQMEHLIA
jgi:two-component system chemotaxis sensor kinase CheA